MTLAPLLVPALRWSPEHGFAHLGRTIDEALEAGVGGFLMFGGPRTAAADLAQELHARSAIPLLIAADAERGAGQQFDGCVPLPPLGALGFLNDAVCMRRAGQVTARDLKRTGLNWALAPVCDVDFAPGNAIIGTRAAGRDPAAVGALIAEWIDGCQSEGVMACAKHFPGHGRADGDSHDALPSVTIGAKWIENDELAPFRAALDAGVASVMTAHVAYPALDPSRVPATLSAAILTSLLRETMEFDGLIVSDALEMRGVLSAGPEPDVAIRAVAAGCDVLLAPSDVAGAVRALERGVQRGELPLDRARDAMARRDQWARWARPAGGREPSLDDEIWSRHIADAAVHVLRGAIPRVGHAVELVLVDDDAAGPWPVPVRAHFAEALDALEVEVNVMDLRSGGTRVPVLVAAYADAVAGKAEAGFSLASRNRVERTLATAREQKRESLVVLFSHPRNAAQFAGAPNVLCAWGGEKPMQAAAARVIARASRS
ncbi:MAG TPA: glycoside hydrolase family 3 N-terminal domain-containing protein [Candidatus Elarobacter sp.]|nr:glycoside hydrolase family 3 N-terminal domain-containing protein [Candidatus Elarobacter sp.]